LAITLNTFRIAPKQERPTTKEQQLIALISQAKPLEVRI
jgi:hypothetical protein